MKMTVDIFAVMLISLAYQDLSKVYGIADLTLGRNMTAAVQCNFYTKD